MAADRLRAIEGGHVVTMDPARAEYALGHVLVRGSRIVAVGPGPAPTPADGEAVERIDARGALVTPGLINTHHHLYQWATRGMAVDSGLFDWLTTLYPVWARVNAEVVGASAQAALAWLARTGCTTAVDHHYVFPHGGGDLIAAEIEAAGAVGLRFMATRGSMDLGQSRGGLPPDEVVESIDDILADSAKAVAEHHDSSPEAMVRVALAPCSPFSVTTDLLRESATLARDLGVRLHTHLAETTDEHAYCLEHFGKSPIDHLAGLGWLGSDVWFAHGIHFDDAGIATLARTGSGVAHCPSSNARLGAGIARLADLRRAGVPVGLGVDGTASNEDGGLLTEVRQALLMARAKGGPEALTVRDALETGTIGAARALGWEDQIGSLEAGKQADLAIWRLDSLPHAGIVDPVAALVLGSRPPLMRLLVGGADVVVEDALVTVDEGATTQAAVTAHRALLPG